MKWISESICIKLHLSFPTRSGCREKNIIYIYIYSNKVSALNKLVLIRLSLQRRKLMIMGLSITSTTSIFNASSHYFISIYIPSVYCYGLNEMANSNCVRLRGHELGDCYIGNTYSQGARIIWKRMSHNAVGFVGYYPQTT